MSDGFLGRWSKRKLDVKEGKAVEGPGPPSPSPASGRGCEGTPEVAAVTPSPLGGEGRGEGPTPIEQSPPPPPPTLDDVKLLTADSNFARFVAPDVTPEVKNAAMKKLFADPHYNVMDRLDVYIDDYSQPDPIPESMLRELVAGKFLRLFETNEEEALPPAQPGPASGGEGNTVTDSRDVADDPAAQVVAQSHAEPPAVTEPTEHADPDLRLQQDDAAPGEDPGRGDR